MLGCWRFPLLCDIIIRSESKSYRSIIIILRRLLRGNTREAMPALFKANCLWVFWALPRDNEKLWWINNALSPFPGPSPVHPLRGRSLRAGPAELEPRWLLQPSRAEAKGIRRWNPTKRSPKATPTSLHPSLRRDGAGCFPGEKAARTGPLGTGCPGPDPPAPLVLRATLGTSPRPQSLLFHCVPPIPRRERGQRRESRGAAPHSP